MNLLAWIAGAVIGACLFFIKRWLNELIGVPHV